MLVFLLYFLLSMTTSSSKITIRDSGVDYVKTDDMALIFFVTLQNTCEREAKVRVDMVQCLEKGESPENPDGHMNLIGGDMGSIASKETKNVTLMYPNLILSNRRGKCLIKVSYRVENYNKEIQKEIDFNTANSGVEDGSTVCPSFDLGGSTCDPVDCVMKYSSQRSFFNKHTNLCETLPECPYDSAYVPKSNKCRNLYFAVSRADLNQLEGGRYEKCNLLTDLINYRCHHGIVSNKTGECVCDEGWTTGPCPQLPYQPYLGIYHMCNLQISSWQEANRQKLIITVLALIILTLAIVAKMLIAVCILNWCCNWLRSKRAGSKESCYIDDCDYANCGDEVCEPEPEVIKIDSSRISRVSFSGMHTGSSATSIATTTPSGYSTSDTESTKSGPSACYCTKK